MNTIKAHGAQPPYRWACSLALVLGLALVAESAWAQGTKVSGYMFGDYYYVAASHNADADGSNGVWFRRITSLA